MLHVRTPTDSPAMARAFARIKRECGCHVLFKQRVRRVLRAPDHPSVAARYGARAETFRHMSLNECCRVSRNLYRAELASFRPSVLTLDVLAELRLILRFLRAKNLHIEFPAIASEIGNRAA